MKDRILNPVSIYSNGIKHLDYRGGGNYAGVNIFWNMVVDWDSGNYQIYRNR